MHWTFKFYPVSVTKRCDELKIVANLCYIPEINQLIINLVQKKVRFISSQFLLCEQ